jgi:hypothetical protein
MAPRLSNNKKREKKDDVFVRLGGKWNYHFLNRDFHNHANQASDQRGGENEIIIHINQFITGKHQWSGTAGISGVDWHIRDPWKTAC